LPSIAIFSASEYQHRPVAKWSNTDNYTDSVFTKSETCTSGGAFGACIYLHARWELVSVTQVFVVIVGHLLFLCWLKSKRDWQSQLGSLNREVRLGWCNSDEWLSKARLGKQRVASIHKKECTFKAIQEGRWTKQEGRNSTREPNRKEETQPERRQNVMTASTQHTLFFIGQTTKALYSYKHLSKQHTKSKTHKILCSVWTVPATTWHKLSANENMASTSLHGNVASTFSHRYVTSTSFFGNTASTCPYRTAA